jgi:DNA polymerase III subunit delta'
MSGPEPRSNTRLLGHDAAQASLLEALRGGRMHHAWLMTGSEGIGKATLAFRFARCLLAGPPFSDHLALDPSHPVFRRVAAGTHADLLTVERAWDEKRRRARSEIVVDDVRAVADFLRLTPAEGGWRVVVVDGAESLNRNAANALLKILEEPPERAALLLVCAAPGRLLPTIRSRCRLLRLSALAEEPMRELLGAYLPEFSETDHARLAALVEGSPGRALTLAAEEGLKIAALVDEVIRGLPEFPLARAYDIADTLGRSEVGFSTFMDLLRAAISRALRAAARGHRETEDQRLAGLRPLDDWGDVWHALTRLQDETEHFNLDKRQAIVSGIALLNGSHMTASLAR